MQAANGWFDISIADPSDARSGLFYFAESDTTPAFGAPRVYFMGASRIGAAVGAIAAKAAP